MKKILYIIILLGSIITVKSQSLGIYVGSGGCYYPNLTTSVMVTQTVSGATSYSWSQLSLTGGCTATFNTLQNGLYGGVTFGCCGTHTITCTAFNGSLVPIATSATVVSFGCAPTLSIAASQTNICSGTSVVLNGAGATSYTWTNGSTALSYSQVLNVSPTSNTCYTLIGLSSSGCYGYTQKCITVSSTPTVSISGPSSICSGDTLVLTASGALSYTWSNGSQVSQLYLLPNSSQCYTVIGANGQGCIGAAVKCVTVSNGPTISGPNSICAGNSAVLHASGGTSYTWQPGGMNSSSISVSPSASTCYTVITSGGCAGSAVKCITVNPTPTISFSGNTSVCQGQASTLTASGAQSYTWYPWQSTGNTIVFTPTAITCFSLMGSNGNCFGGTGTCVTIQPTNLNVSGPSVVCPGQSAVLTVTNSGTFTWQPGGVVGNSITISPSVGICYTVNGTSGSCFVSATKCVSVSSVPTLTVTGSPIVCQGSYGFFSAQGASSYTWYPSMQTGSTIANIPLSSGCYTVAGSNAAGCTGYGSYCFSVVPSPTVSVSGNALVCGGASATLTASGASSYTWYPLFVTTSASIVVSPSVSTCYTLTGSNGGPCTASAIKCVTVQNTNVSVAGPSSICGGQSATLTASGAAGYTWQPGNLTGASIVVSPTANTCYTVTGSTGTSVACSSATVKCITVNQFPVITTGSSGFCAGQAGQIFASGATSYTWYPFNTTGSLVTITPSISGCYTVVGTNSAGCMGSAFGCYSVFPTPTISVSGPTVMCPSTSDTLLASGASSYTWLPGGLSGNIVVISPTASTCYTILGTGANGCIAGVTKCVSVQNGSLTVSGPNAVCSGGSVTLTASGAGSYTWQPGNLNSSSIVVSPSVATCYTVSGTITNGNCQASAVKCVGVGSTPVITTNAGTYCAGQQAVITAQGTSSYTWLPFGNTGSVVVFTPTASACLTVLGTNSAGCTGTVVNCYSVIPAPTVSITGNTFLCPGDSTILTASGASSYTWLPGGNTGASLFVSPMSSTCYTLIASNGFCTSSALKCIQVSPNPSVSITGSNFACAGNPLVLVASGASSYMWSNGATTPSIVVTPTASGCYTVTGSNGPNCSSSAVKCFSLVNSVSLSIGGTQTICRGQLANITVSGAQTYKWNTGSTSSVLFVSPAFTSVYTVTGSIGTCSEIRTVQVTVNQSPTISVVSSNSAVCPGMTAVLHASGATSYTWLPQGLTSPSIAVTPTATTMYVVQGTSSQGCVGAASITITQAQCTSIAASGEVKHSLMLYPNPASGKVTLVNDSDRPGQFYIFDITGRELMKGDFKGSIDVDISGLAAGTYHVRCASEGRSINQKLIVE